MEIILNISFKDDLLYKFFHVSNWNVDKYCSPFICVYILVYIDNFCLQDALEQSKFSEIERDVWGVEANDLVPAEITKLSNCVPRAKEEVIDLLAAEKDSESDREILKAVDEVLTDLI